MSIRKLLWIAASVVAAAAFMSDRSRWETSPSFYDARPITFAASVPASRVSKMSNYTFDREDEGVKTFDNAGASRSIDFILPRVPLNSPVCVTIAVSQAVEIIAPPEVMITVRDLTTLPGGHIVSSVIGSHICLYMSPGVADRYFTKDVLGVWFVF